MKSIPRISDAEWEVMRIVWEQYPITSNEVIAQLGATNRKWHPNTTRTLIARLVKKKALATELQGRAYGYTPCVSEEECVAHASESFLTRVFGGSLEPMLAHFVTRQHVARQDLAQLRRLLDEIDDDEASLPPGSR